MSGTTAASRARSPRQGGGAPNEEAVLGRAYDARLVRRLWTYMRPHRLLFWLCLLLLPVAAGFDLLGPVLLKYGIDHDIVAPRGSHARFSLAAVAAAYLATLLLQYAASYWQLWTATLLGQRAMRTLRQQVYEHVLSLRAAFFDRTPVGRLLTRMTNDVEAINEMFASGFVGLVGDAVKLAGIIVVLLATDVHLTLVTFLAVPALVLLVAVVRPAMREAFRRTRTQLARLNAYLAEHLSGMKVVQLFVREARTVDRFDALSDDLRHSFHTAIKWDSILYAVVEGIATVTVAGILWVSGRRVLGGVLTFGTIVLFVSYIDKFFAPIRDFSAKYTILQQAMAASERIFGLLDTVEPDAPVAPGTAAVPAANEDGAATPHLALEQVGFAYRAGTPILQDVSFAVGRGETVAVVGPTGAGKSTLIKLVTRLYEIGEGRIRLAGRDVRSIDAGELRRRVVVVAQDVFLFAGTLRDNLRIGLGDGAVDDDVLRAAIARVGADSLLARPGGLDQPVAERGANFSSGERQLLSFARALVRAPEVLVLDEATASVDPEAETRIERGLAALMEGRTSLVIAHRLSTIQRADRIVALHRGRVAEIGRHDELLARGGLYARLVALQQGPRVARALA